MIETRSCRHGTQRGATVARRRTVPLDPWIVELTCHAHSRQGKRPVIIYRAARTSQSLGRVLLCYIALTWTLHFYFSTLMRPHIRYIGSVTALHKCRPLPKHKPLFLGPSGSPSSARRRPIRSCRISLLSLQTSKRCTYRYIYSLATG
jgi:hypothetical protein